MIRKKIKMVTNGDIKFMKAVFREWGYYSETAHKQANDIKEKMKGGN